MKTHNTGQSDANRTAGLRQEAPSRRTQVRVVLREGVIVALMGVLFAFVANFVSPRGLALVRNYFPGPTQSPLLSTNITRSAPGTAETNIAVPSPAKLLAPQLRAKGLQLVESRRAEELFHDPRFEQELIVFVDARDDQHYQEGHIPGAYQFNHYHAENYLATVLPVCQTAEQIVVYCTGGDCEDSEFAAIFLRDAGIAKEKLFVYAGGMTEWNTNGLPVEIGGRKSGKFRPFKP